MLAIALATGWLSQTTAIEISGDAAFYRPGLMAQVAEARRMGLDGYAGGVALMPCGDLGREVWVRFPGGWAGPFLVVHCSQQDHYEVNLARGRVVDLSRETWQAQRLPRRPVPVSVRFRAPEGTGGRHGDNGRHRHHDGAGGDRRLYHAGDQADGAPTDHRFIPLSLAAVLVCVGLGLAWLQGQNPVEGGLQGFFSAALAVYGYQFLEACSPRVRSG